jgi:AraC-like DNA-binding protein
MGTKEQPVPEAFLCNWEEVCLLEELELSYRATGIMKKFRQMKRLEGPVQPRPKRRLKPEKQNIPSTIDPQELKGKIDRKFREEKIFLDEDLSLAGLAHELDLEPHHLSRFLNFYLQTTFINFLNGYRIREAKTLLEKEPPQTVLEIAFASGFNSKASFNRIFKKATGMTPSEYRLSAKGHTSSVPAGRP